MAKKVDRERFRQFVDELMADVPITDFYTMITSETFVSVQSRLKAKNIWREDSNPSMQTVPGRNILWDFAAADEKSGGRGRGYNHIDILRMSKLASSYYDAVSSLAKYANRVVPEEFTADLAYEGNRIDFMNAVWYACCAFRDNMFREPDRYPSIKKFCAERNIPFDKTFWETMNIGIWPDEATIKDLRSDKLHDKHPDIKTDFVNAAYKSIVFPLHTKNGTLGGFTVRDTTYKRFNKCIAMSNCFYGLREAIAQEQVYIFEGEMNYVQYAAAMHRKHGANFASFIPYGFCTGSVNANLDTLADQFESVIYFPDVREKKDKKDRDTALVVIDVYNQLRAHQFMTVYWGCESDKFDLDDYIVREINNKNWETDLQKFICSLPQYLYRSIEDRLITTFDDEVKNGARFGWADTFAKNLYNGADKMSLLAYYSGISADSVNQDVVDQISSSVEDKIDDGFLSQNNCYYVLSVDSNGEKVKTKISDFIIKPASIVVYQKSRNSLAGEFSTTKSEAFRIQCIVQFANGRKVEVSFEPTATIDEKEFWKTISTAVVDIKRYCDDKNLSKIFSCATKRMTASQNEIIQISIPGPHLRNEGNRSTTLRPDLFGGTPRTFLSRGYSVIDGEIKSNRQLKIQFESSSDFSFGIYSDSDHAEMSKVAWSKLRKIHKPEVIDRMIGFGCSTAIKHIVDKNVQSLIMFVYGLTASYKTSCARLIQNFFAEIYQDERLYNFNSTKKAVEKTIAMLGSNLAVFDELKPNQEYDEKALGELIHHLYGGRSRTRLDTHSDLKDADSFTSNIIFTGERRLDLESSVEARHLQVRAENLAEGNLPLFEFLSSTEMIPRYKCFGARLIAWQHKNIDHLIEVYNERKQGHMKDLEEHRNRARLAVQEAMIDLGFYSFAKFCQESGACSVEECEADIQSFFIQTSKDAVVQATRASEMLSTKKFVEYLKELIQTKTINMAIVKDAGQKASVTYTQGMRNNVLMIKFNRGSESFYAIPSLDLLLKMINQAYGKDRAVTTSIKEDLSQVGWCKLDAKRQIAPQNVPDIGEAEGKREKRMRVVVIPANVLEDDNDQVNQGGSV